MISLKLNNILRPIGIHTGILIGLFLSKFFYYLIFTQKHSICPKEYRGKKIRVKNRPDFFACDIGGGV